jgi:hypothetical protein
MSNYLPLIVKNRYNGMPNGAVLTAPLGVAQLLLQRKMAEPYALPYRAAVTELRDRFNDVADNVIMQAVKESAAASTYEPGATYELGDVVIPVKKNGHRYVCIKPGQTSEEAQTWPRGEGTRIFDGEAMWQEFGHDKAELFSIPKAHAKVQQAVAEADQKLVEGSQTGGQSGASNTNPDGSGDGNQPPNDNTNPDGSEGKALTTPVEDKAIKGPAEHKASTSPKNGPR